VEDVYENEIFMDDDIIEPLHENHFHHKGKNVEASCHDTQENSQHVVVSPLVVNEENQENFQQIVVSFVAENEIDLHLNDEIHIPSPKIVEEIQWSYQILGDQGEVYDGKSIFSTVVLSLESLIEEQVVLDILDGVDIIHDFTPLELTNYEILKD